MNDTFVDVKIMKLKMLPNINNNLHEYGFKPNFFNLNTELYRIKVKKQKYFKQYHADIWKEIIDVYFVSLILNIKCV